MPVQHVDYSLLVSNMSFDVRWKLVKKLAEALSDVPNNFSQRESLSREERSKLRDSVVVIFLTA